MQKSPATSHLIFIQKDTLVEILRPSPLWLNYSTREDEHNPGKKTKNLYWAYPKFSCFNEQTFLSLQLFEVPKWLFLELHVIQQYHFGSISRGNSDLKRYMHPSVNSNTIYNV